MTDVKRQEERLAKAIAASLGISRRKAEWLVTEGDVTVNGAVVKDLATKVDPHRDHIKVKGELQRGRPAPMFIKFHKPEGCLCTTSDPRGRPTVIDMLPRKYSHLFPVGRLDFNTSGLLFFTNDGDWAQRMTHPTQGVRKTYQARISGVPTATTVARLLRGVSLNGRRVEVHLVRILKRGDDRCWIELEIHEGRKHVVRDLLERVGHSVIRLRRMAIGAVGIQDLPPGMSKALTPRELKSLAAIMPRMD